jgi:hypothetical protein
MRRKMMVLQKGPRLLSDARFESGDVALTSLPNKAQRLGFATRRTSSATLILLDRHPNQRHKKRSEHGAPSRERGNMKRV